LKHLIKVIIEQIVELLHKLKLIRSIETRLKYTVYSTKNKHTFFGYYDKSPFNDENSKLLAITTNHDDIISKPEEAIIGYFNLHDNRNYFEIDKTTTWCWQQGCRLMWFGKDSVIYNKVVDDNYGSIVYDIKNNKQIKKFNFAVYDKTSDNKLALSLNFSRLQYFRPGYGYCNFLTANDKKSVIDNDGVYLCSLEHNTQELIIPLTKIISTKNDERMNNADHYINHLKFSPDDNVFIFYHIWNKNQKRYTRVFLANIKGEILNVFDNQTFMSHDTFKNSNESLIFTKRNQKGYYLYNFEKNVSQIIFKKLQVDGHPTYVDNDRILTDTYPDKISGRQKLILFSNKQLNVIAKIFSPKRFRGEFRCDLHPRLSNDKKLISIDIPTFKGKKIIVLESEFETS